LRDWELEEAVPLPTFAWRPFAFCVGSEVENRRHKDALVGEIIADEVLSITSYMLSQKTKVQI
jgi:hypothetical protein